MSGDPAPTQKLTLGGRGLRPLALALAIPAVLLGLLSTGLAVLQEGEGGYFSSPVLQLSSPTNALMSREVEVGAEGGYATDPAYDLGELAEVRVRVSPADSRTPVFVGIASVEDVRGYLSRTEYDEMRNYTATPLKVNYDRHGGDATPAAPADQRFWVAQAHGASQSQLTWAKEPGAWAIVAMNADGRPDVDVKADIGLRFGFLGPLGLGLLAVSALLLLAWRWPRRPSHG